MTTSRLLVTLTVLNLGLLTFSLARSALSAGPESAPILRGRGLEIVDDQGRLTILPADPKAAMPDGTVGSPETVLLRLITAQGRPNVKIAATERGAGQLLAAEADPAYVQLLAEGGKTSLRLSNHHGKVNVLTP